MAVALRAVEHRSARTIVREFIEHQIEDQDEIALEALQVSARDLFWDDAEMHAALLTDALPTLVADVLHNLMRSRRSATTFYRTESGYVSDTRVELGAREIFARIFESVGGGQRKSLITMTKADINEAIGQRNKMIDGLARYNEFLGALAEPLRGKETVGDHYSDGQLKALWDRLRATPTSTEA
jgi:hypothetical protein